MLVFAKLVNGLSERRRKINSWRCKDRSARPVTRVTIVVGRCLSLGWPTAGESSQQPLPGPNNKPQFIRPKRKERKKKEKRKKKKEKKLVTQIGYVIREQTKNPDNLNFAKPTFMQIYAFQGPFAQLRNVALTN